MLFDIDLAERRLIDLDDEVKFLPSHPRAVVLQRGVENIIQQILETVGVNDPRFRSRLVPAGSFYDGVKVGRHYEFDNEIKLVEVSVEDLCQVDRHNGPMYVVVHPTNGQVTEQWEEFLQPMGSCGAVLDSAKTNIAFLRAVEVAVESVQFPAGWSPDSQIGIVDPNHYLTDKTPTSPTGIYKPIYVRQNGPAIMLGLHYNVNYSQTDDEEERAKLNHDFECTGHSNTET